MAGDPLFVFRNVDQKTTPERLGEGHTSPKVLITTREQEPCAGFVLACFLRQTSEPNPW